MIDPITLTGVALLGLGRLLSWRDHSNARKELGSAQKNLAAVAERLFGRTEILFDRMKRLNDRRASYLRRLFVRVSRIATRLDDWNAPFDPKRGWFGGKGFEEGLQLAESAYQLATPPRNVIDNKVNLAAWSVLLVQGLEQLDAWKVIELPILDDSLADTVSSFSPDMAAGLSELGASTVADALGVLTLVYSFWRIGSNLAKAQEARVTAEALRHRTVEARTKLKQVLELSHRAQSLNQSLDDAAYEAFKTAWMVEQLLDRFEMERLSQHHRPLLESFERAARGVWASLNEPLMDSAGYARG